MVKTGGGVVEGVMGVVQRVADRWWGGGEGGR